MLSLSLPFCHDLLGVLQLLLVGHAQGVHQLLIFLQAFERILAALRRGRFQPLTLRNARCPAGR